MDTQKTSCVNGYHFSDTAVIYHSTEDNCWIAHSLRTDQIGTGERVVDALADLIRGVRAVLRLAQKDESIAYLREAPPEIKKLATRSRKLPHEGWRRIAPTF
ncbi:MAG: hypothetical protein ACP5I8_16525 [Phycisphaerae bacterium]